MSQIDALNDMAFARVPTLSNLVATADSHPWMLKAVALRPDDGGVELAAALIMREHHRRESDQHAARAREIAATEPLLARTSVAWCTDPLTLDISTAQDHSRQRPSAAAILLSDQEAASRHRLRSAAWCSWSSPVRRFLSSASAKEEHRVITAESAVHSRAHL
jgi:hypothetical protein